MLLLFEVSDKFPSWTTSASLGVALGLLCFALARFRWWLVTVGLALGAWFAWTELDFWIRDPMSAALIQEQGHYYFALPLATHIFVIAAATYGSMRAWRAGQVGHPTKPRT